MQSDYESIVIKHLHMTDDQQKIVIRQFGNLTIEMRIEVLQQHRKAFYAARQKNNEVPISIISYIALLQTISDYIGEKHQFIKISKIKKGVKKSRFKSNKLIERWALIKELRQGNNMSFRDIAKYLEKYHKLKVAHSTIFEMWQKLESEEK